MPEPKDGVKDPAAPAGKEGVKDGDAPSPEALREANKVAEQYRKEAEAAKEAAEEAKESLEEMQAEIAELRDKDSKSAADRKRIALLQAGIEDDEVLVEQLEAQARGGDKVAKAYLAAMERRAKLIAEKVVETHFTKREYERDLNDREDWLESKSKEHGMVSDDFFKEISEHADASLKNYPSKQARMAYKRWLEVQEVKKGKAEIEEFKKANENFRDSGTSQVGDKSSQKSGKADWSKPGSWKDAKTPEEKEAAAVTVI